MSHNRTGNKLHQVSEFVPLLDLGMQPVSNRFVDMSGNETAPRFPLKLALNKNSGLIKLITPFPVEEVKPRYSWLTCFEPEDHLDEMVKTIIDLPEVNHETVFGAYSFKDDSTLERLKKLGYRHTWRIDPVFDLGVKDPCANVETYQSVFNNAVANKIVKNHGSADVIIVRHVVEHAYDIELFINTVKQLVKPGGLIVWELPDCERAITQGDCTTIWEEHIHYFTPFTFKQLISNYGLNTEHFQSVPYALENSLIVISRVEVNANQKQDIANELVEREISHAMAFASAIQQRKKKVRKALEKINNRQGKIAIFGAGHLSVAFISIMEIADLVDCVLDDNPNKNGMLMPIGDIPIVGSENLYSGEIKACLLGLNPQNQPNVVSRHQAFIKDGGLIYSIFPDADNDIAIYK